jgi:hypothetical protein
MSNYDISIKDFHNLINQILNKILRLMSAYDMVYPFINL